MLMRRALAVKTAAAAALFLLLPSSACLAADAPGDKQAVIKRMKACAAALRAIPAKSSSLKTPPACAQVAKPQSITGGGETVRIDNTWIADDIEVIQCALDGGCVPCVMARRLTKKLKKDKDKKPGEKCGDACGLCRDPVPETKNAGQLLSGLADAIDAAASAQADKIARTSDVASAKKTLAVILAADEYTQYEKNKLQKRHKEKKGPSLWDKFVKWLRKYIPEDKRAPRAPQSGGGIRLPMGVSTDVLRAVIATLVILAVALAAALIFVRFRRALADEAEEKALEENGGPSKAARQMLTEAEMLRRKGEYRLAIRSLFLAFLRLLEQRGLVVFIKNKTNGEYLRELRKKKAAGPEIEKLNLLFEEAWYGMKDCTGGDYDEFLAVYEKCSREV